MPLLTSHKLDLENVRARPALLDRILKLSPYGGTAVYPNVFVSQQVYDNLCSDSPNASHLALLGHEQVHIQRIKSYGILRWYIRYLLDPAFRLDEEIEATKVQFRYLKRASLDPHLENRARRLSGSTYLWATTYTTAYKKLQSIWEAAEKEV